MSGLKGVILATVLGGGAPPLPIVEATPCECPWEDADAAVLARVQHDTVRAVAAAGISGTVHARLKTASSVLAKMQRKGLPREAIADRLGVRVIVDSVEDCYAVRDLLRARFDEIGAEYDDYIARPKANGYRSLHVVLRAGPAGEVTEFQIRTAAMHAHAEHGGAAHAAYKQAMAA